SSTGPDARWSTSCSGSTVTWPRPSPAWPRPRGEPSGWPTSSRPATGRVWSTRVTGRWWSGSPRSTSAGRRSTPAGSSRCTSVTATTPWSIVAAVIGVRPGRTGRRSSSLGSVTQQPIRVMVVDDHPMWRDAVERDLKGAGLDVVAVAASGTEAVVRFSAVRPQVVVLDLQIPAPNGVEVTRTVLAQDPSARVLILSASGEQAGVLEALKAGATGYLVKSASSNDLIAAVRRVARGGTVFTPGLAG